MSEQYILALDQGTTSSRATLFDKNGQLVQIAQKEFEQFYPQPGWVEHDAMEIWATQSGVAREVLERSGVSPHDVAAIGITNQRETTIIWDKETGKPIAPAIVWQDRRTADLCDQMKRDGWGDEIQRRTGLVIDAYFSGTKIKWLLDHNQGARDMAKQGRLLFGTVDTWLIWNLTRGQVHATDVTNASRTMLFDIHRLQWDDEILAAFDIPREMLPEVRQSSDTYGVTDPGTFGAAQIPISGVAGDQHAALFGQGCLEEGSVKNTYGTGCFLLMNTGSEPVQSENGLLTTIAWSRNGNVQYALEGSIFIAGAAVQWLRDGLKMIDSAAQSEIEAAKVENTGGVYVVPAFAGLGAPYWDMYARGAIFGLTRGTSNEHVIRATLESLAFQTKDVVDAMQRDAGLNVSVLRADGGASANDLLMQFQADILDTCVERPRITETTALGAACLAALKVGFWDEAILRGEERTDRSFLPNMDHTQRDLLVSGWKKAVQRVMNWEDASNSDA